MKLLYCIAGTRHAGGMERVLANKANYLVNQGYEVVIVTTDQQKDSPYFPLDKRIRYVDLNINYEENNGKSFLNKVVKYPFKQWKHRKRLAALLQQEKPDITISMFCNDASFLPQMTDGSKKILEIHFSKFKRLQYGRKGLWHWADLWLSKQDDKAVSRFDKFVVLTEEDKGYWGALPNITVIPNARTFTPSTVSSLQEKEAIAVGRFTYQKGFGRLIAAWKIVCEKYPDWHLSIVGGGEEYELLLAEIDKLNLKDNISLLPPTNRIGDLYQKSSMMLLSSRYEGLPMVLLEAQAYGLPIVAFDCKCGPKDIIHQGKDGFLVAEGDVESLAMRMMELMNDEKMRNRMGQMARISSEKFSEEVIMQKWMNLFDNLVRK